MSSSEDSVDTRLGRIEGKLDVLLDIHKERHEDHEDRLRGLEERKNWVAGAAAVIGVGASALYNYMFGGGHHG